jgi:hypothetical protein
MKQLLALGLSKSKRPSQLLDRLKQCSEERLTAAIDQGPGRYYHLWRTGKFHFTHRTRLPARAENLNPVGETGGAS